MVISLLIDIGEVRKYIKPKADSTLRNMRKDDLLDYIRCLEHNYNVAVSFNENQAKYIESLNIASLSHGEWIWGKVEPGYITPGGNRPWVCSKCGHIASWMLGKPIDHYCPNCGAKMDGDGNG